ncbi:MAG TPA: PA2779 family protein [Candidatus Angelobacter sp.]|nr:PA2779 family protein [Candidatus Angelobacter sp.]
MQLNVRQSVRALIASVLAMLFLVPADMVAQNHVVSPADLQREVMSASQARQHNIETLQQFLSTPAAEKAIKSAQMDPRQVKTAVSALDDQDLAQLAARANKAQVDFAAGSLSDRDLIWIVVGIAVIVLIIVAVR